MPLLFPDPHLLEAPKLGQSPIGYISVLQSGDAASQGMLPFDVQRVFWTYYTPESIMRGGHAHKLTQQLLFAVTGQITVEVENALGEARQFQLDKPHTGIYLPPHWWHTMRYSHNAVQLVLASTIYKPDDYLRDKSEFQRYWGA